MWRSSCLNTALLSLRSAPLRAPLTNLKLGDECSQSFCSAERREASGTRSSTAVLAGAKCTKHSEYHFCRADAGVRNESSCSAWTMGYGVVQGASARPGGCPQVSAACTVRNTQSHLPVPRRLRLHAFLPPTSPRNCVVLSSAYLVCENKRRVYARST